MSDANNSSNNIVTAKPKRSVPPPSGPAPNTAAANYRAKAKLPPPSSQPKVNSASEWRRTQNAESKLEAKGSQPKTKSFSLEDNNKVVKKVISFDEEAKKDVRPVMQVSGLSDAAVESKGVKAPKNARVRAVPLSGARKMEEESEIKIVKAERKTKVVRNEVEDKTNASSRYRSTDSQIVVAENEDMEEIPDLEDLSLNKDGERVVPKVEQVEEKEEEMKQDQEVEEKQEEKFSEISQVDQPEVSVHEPKNAVEDEQDEKVQDENVQDDNAQDEYGQDDIGQDENERTEDAEEKEQSRDDVDEHEQKDSLEHEEEKQHSDSDSSDSVKSKKMTPLKAAPRKDSIKHKKKGKSYQLFDHDLIPTDAAELRDFVYLPLPAKQGTILRCFIERDASGLNKLTPEYTLLVEIDKSCGRPLLFAKKVTGRTPHYAISTDRFDLEKPRGMRSDDFIGKVRGADSNCMQYTVFDGGNNPKLYKPDEDDAETVKQYLRSELCHIVYRNSKKESVRKMEIAIPCTTKKLKGTSFYNWQPSANEENMAQAFAHLCEEGTQNIKDTKRLCVLHRRETKYDALSSCIVDYRSRATCVSVKNFQLVHSKPQHVGYQDEYEDLYPEHVYTDSGTTSVPVEHVILQMGKVGNDCFNVDFQYPLSLTQAFAICLTRFDTKLR